MGQKKEILSALITKESIERMKSAMELLGSIESLEIKTEAENNAAAEIQKSVKKAIKDLESDRTDIVKPYNDKVKAINEKFKSVTTALDSGSRKISIAMSTWFTAEQKRRDEEKKRLEAIAEEARRKQEEAIEKERLKAEAYREKGRDDLAEKAEARAEAKAEVIATIVAPEIEQVKTNGISYRTDYDVEITNIVEAAKELLESPFTQAFVIIDNGAFKKFAASVMKNGNNFNFKNIKITEKKVQVVRT